MAAALVRILDIEQTSAIAEKGHIPGRPASQDGFMPLDGSKRCASKL
jgi:hypothetical protein